MIACTLLLSASCAVQEKSAELYEIPGLGISASTDKSVYTALADNGPLRNIRLFSEYRMKGGEVVEEWFLHNNHDTRPIRVKVAYHKGTLNERRKYYRTYVLSPGEVQSIRLKRTGDEKRILANLEKADYLR